MPAPTERHVAVIDVGKTNKKVHIYDERLSLVDARSRSFDPVVEDGIPRIASAEVEEWLLDTLSALNARYPVELISVATHGAACACVDEKGELAIPIVDYTYEPGEWLHEQFFREFGAPEELQRRTATVALPGLLNVAQALYFYQQTMPDAWKRVRHVLFYPQFFAMRLTGKVGADFTYVACHSFLFDFQKMDYSYIADGLHVRELLPESITDPGNVLGSIDPEIAARTGISPAAQVTLGVHDSNSSLLPYLIKKPGEDLIVNSTGTWCVAMHPEERVSFAEEEIGKAVFYNMSALRQPVKTSILMGGLEFETYTKILRDRFGLGDVPGFDPSIYQDVVHRASEFILPAVVPGTGQFPDSQPRVVDHDQVFPLADLQAGRSAPELFSSTKRAIAVLNLSLAIQTITALERVGLAPGVTVYTEGGFRNNHDYNTLLSALAPQAIFRLSGMPEATSFGAALLGWSALEERAPSQLRERFELTEEPVAAVELPGLEAYVEAFWRHLDASGA